MQDFLKQWGPAIITAVAVLAIIALLSALMPSIQKGMGDIVSNFGEKASADANVDMSGTGGNIANNDSNNNNNNNNSGVPAAVNPIVNGKHVLTTDHYAFAAAYPAAYAKFKEELAKIDATTYPYYFMYINNSNTRFRIMYSTKPFYLLDMGSQVGIRNPAMMKTVDIYFNNTTVSYGDVSSENIAFDTGSFKSQIIHTNHTLVRNNETFYVPVR